MGILGSDLAILAEAVSPSRTGICRSIMARSGLDSTAICTASAPFEASAQTLQSFEWASRTFLSVERTDKESSAIRILAGAWTALAIVHLCCLSDINFLSDILHP